MLSVAGAQVRLMLVVVRVEAVTLLGAVGGWVSVQADVVTDIVACGDVLPAASSASTPTGYAVPQVRPLKVAVVCWCRPDWLEPR